MTTRNDWVRNNWPELCLIFIITIGVSTRLITLNSPFLHTDEKFTIDLIRHSWQYIITYSFTQDCNPPLYYLLAKASVEFYGFYPWVERLPAFIAGVWCIPAAYDLGKEYSGTITGIIAALFVSLLGCMWYYSQFGRGYTLLCLLFMLLAIYYIRIVRGDASRSAWVTFGILGALCIWTHLFAAIPVWLLTTHIILRLPFDVDELRRKLLCLTPIPLSVGMFAFLFVSIASNRINGASLTFGNTPQEILTILPLEYFGYAIIPLVPLMIYTITTRINDEVVGGLTVAWFITLIAQLIIAIKTPVFARYSLLFVPILCVLAADAISRFVKSDGSSTIQKVFIVAVILGIFLVTVYLQLSLMVTLPNGADTI